MACEICWSKTVLDDEKSACVSVDGLFTAERLVLRQPLRSAAISLLASLACDLTDGPE